MYRHKSLTDIIIPKIPLNSASFVSQDLMQAYLEAPHRLVHFHFSEEESSRQMTQRTQNSSYIGLCECEVRQFFYSYRAGALLRSHTFEAPIERESRCVGGKRKQKGKETEKLRPLPI